MELWQKMKIIKGVTAAFKTVFVNNSPKSFEANTAALAAVCEVKRSLKVQDKVGCVISFVQAKADVESQAQKINTWTIQTEDSTIWFAYPKKSSKNYTSDMSRDDGFQCLGSVGLEPVSAISIDSDWSALRFRRVEFIKTMTRSFAMTEEGKEKVADSKKRGISCKASAAETKATKSLGKRAMAKDVKAKTATPATEDAPVKKRAKK